MDGRVGVGQAGTDETACTVNLAVARRATPTGAAVLATLSNPSALHVPFLVCDRLGVLVRPATVLVNQTGLITPVMVDLTRGPVQFGVAEAVSDAPMIRQLTAWLVNEILVLVALHLPIELAHVAPTPSLEDHVHRTVRLAARRALENAMELLPFAVVVPLYPAPQVRSGRAASR